jgi:hypothetical protein
MMVCWGHESPIQMVCRRLVIGILRKAGVNFGSVVRK